MAAQRCQPRMPAIVCMASIHSLQFVARDSDVLVHVAVAAAITTRVQTSDLERAICGGDAMRAHPSRRSTRWPP